jgi:alcohol dehydrogenase (cytochrome c)
MNNASCARLVLIGAALVVSTSLRAAEVTYERLQHPEPQNWLMNHHDYGSQRFSALDAINKSNIKNLKLKFAVALGGKSGNESLEATPLVEDGFMYVADGWGAVYKIDVRSGSAGHIVWKMDPGQGRLDRNRGVALWGNLVISVTSQDARVVATDKESGKIVWDKNLHDQPDIELDAAPLALKDSIVIGASGGDRGLRDWIASLDAKTGELQWKTYSIPAPGEPGSETWKDKTNAWQSGGGAFYVTGAFDPATNLTYWGTGNPVPGYDAARRPGDNLYTSSVLALDAASGKINWYFQYTPNDNRDYDETGTHILIDTKINGEDRKVVSHAGRNGFEYFLDRQNGQFLKAVQHVDQVTWTKGIDPKTGKPVEYDPGKDFQVYADSPNVNDDKVSRRVCPDTAGGTNYWPAAYSGRTKLIYIPALESCSQVATDYSKHVKGNFTGGTTGGAPGSPNTSSIVALDPVTGAIKLRKTLPYPNFAGVLSTGGGLIFTALLDGTIVALDDETLDELWAINVGSGFNAPPMTYAVDGKQYIAIASGLFNNARGRLNRLPDLKGMSSATMVFVFGL